MAKGYIAVTCYGARVLHKMTAYMWGGAYSSWVMYQARSISEALAYCEHMGIETCNVDEVITIP